MRRSSLGCILILGCSCFGCTEDHDVPQEDPELRAIFDAAEEAGFSGVAVVRQADQQLLARAAGEASRAKGVLNTSATPFDIGSLTKQFTAAAVLKLVEQDELMLTSRLDEFFDDLPEDKAAITVHQLLTHTAGFAGALGDDDEVIERDAYLTRAFETGLYYEPGTVYSYSNVGYSILAAIIEERSGLSYEQYLNHELFEPAGMDQTGYLLPTWREPVATGFSDDEIDEPLERPHDETGYYWNLRGNGGLLSTAHDLLRWHDALAFATVLSEESVELLQSPHADEGLGYTFYGYGWVVEPTSAGRLLWHDGGNGFFFAQMLRFEDADLQIVTLANEENEPALELARKLASSVLPELEGDEIDITPVFERQLEFEDETDQIVETVEVESGQTHLAGFGLFAEAGSVACTVIDPNGEVFLSDRAEAGQLRERSFRLEDMPGTWSMRAELTSATGDLWMAWGIAEAGEGEP